MAGRTEKRGGNRSGGSSVARSTEKNSLRRVGPGSQATSREIASQQQQQPHNGNMNRRTRRPSEATAASTAEAEGPRQRRRINPCCSCYRTSTCTRRIFDNGDGRSQGCECRTAGRKCTNCACKSNCTNNHISPTPQSTTRTGISSFFSRRTAIALPPPTPNTAEGTTPDNDNDSIEDEESDGENANDIEDPIGDTVPDSNNIDDSNDSTEDDEGTEGRVDDNNPTEPDNEEVEGVNEDEVEPREESNNEEATGAEGDGDDDENVGDNATDEGERTDLLPPDEGADLEDYVSSQADRKLDSLYGDHAHDNDGTHLDGGIGAGENAKWIRYWKRCVQIKPLWYKNPQGRIGKNFIRKLAMLLRGVRNRDWNSERVIVFPAVILYKSAGVTASKDIRARIEARMKLWDEGRYSALLEDMEVEARMRGGTRRVKTEEESDRDFNARVLSGHLRSAVRGITERNGGSVLSPDDTCSKAGIPVLDVLRSKHPHLREPMSIGQPGGTFEDYPSIPITIPLIIATDVVEDVVTKLGGSAGPGGADAEAMKAWCLGFGMISELLRSEIAMMTTWIANRNPPWAAYRALMACRLVALDKQPGTRPLGIGESIRRLMAKCVLKCVGDRATDACGNYNLCAGLKAGIEGAVHVIREAEKDAKDAVDRAKVQDESDTDSDEDGENGDEESEDDDPSDGEEGVDTRIHRVSWSDQTSGASRLRHPSGVSGPSGLSLFPLVVMITTSEGMS